VGTVLGEGSTNNLYEGSINTSAKYLSSRLVIWIRGLYKRYVSKCVNNLFYFNIKIKNKFTLELKL
jgi:hypothetical protein